MTAIVNFLEQTGFYLLGQDGNWKCLSITSPDESVYYWFPPNPNHTPAYDFYTGKPKE